MKIKYISILFIVIGYFITSLIVVYALNVIQPGKAVEAIAIPIAFLNIFATGYGAYIGAKISGENASKLMKDQIIITELNQNSYNDITFLSSFNEILFTLDFHKINKDKIDIEDIYMFKKVFLKLLDLEFRSCSSIIKFEYMNFIDEYKKINENIDALINKLDKSINEYFLKEELKLNEEDFKVKVTNVEFKNILQNKRWNKKTIETYVFIYNLKKNITLYNDKEKVDSIYEIDVNDCFRYIYHKYNKEIGDTLLLLADLLKTYSNITIKNEKDLSKFVLKYYKK